eukprot:14853826-Alexandrium_andersonii.AAC.1
MNARVWERRGETEVMIGGHTLRTVDRRNPGLEESGQMLVDMPHDWPHVDEHIPQETGGQTSDVHG